MTTTYYYMLCLISLSNDLGSSYTKIEYAGPHRGDQGSVYPTLALAQSACSQLTNCTMGFDMNCKGSAFGGYWTFSGLSVIPTGIHQCLWLKGTKVIYIHK